MDDIEEFVRSLEFPIGTRFYFKNTLLEVAELEDDGVIIGDSKINTTQVSSDRYFTANDTTEWEELFNKYTFLDGSPCGKEVK